MAFVQRSLSAVSLPVRPLDKGMILDQASQVLPEGAFIDLKNYYPSSAGPRRRPGFAQYAAGQSVPYPFVDYVTVWSPDGTQTSILMTSKFLYRVNALTGFTRIEWDYTGPGIATASGATFTDPSASFTTNDIMPGDIVAVGSYRGTVASVDSATQLTIADYDIPPGSGYSYTVQRALGPGINELPDWTVFNGLLALADGKRPLLKYNPETNALGYWTTDSAKKLQSPVRDFVPGCVASFQDRIWCGYTVDSEDGARRQRIRWSTLADETDFSTVTAYLDLPYVNGALRRLVPLANTLVAYFDDAVFIGTQTNNPLLPCRFDLVDTGSIGLVGPKAVTSFLGGHFYVGQDDMYFLSREGAQRIGSPIVKASIRACQLPERVYVAMDPWNTSVIFGMPGVNEYMETLWVYDYKSRAWSYLDIDTWMITNPVVNVNLQWNDLSGTWDALSDSFPSWNSIKLDDPRKFLFIESGSKLWKSTEAGATDFNTSAIAAAFTTKDHDFDAPDDLKTIVRLGLKLDADQTLTGPVQFAVEASINRGKRWKPVGTITIPATGDEGYVNFRVTGSTVRFRLTSTSPVESYTITEYVIKARLHGSERDVSTQV